MAKIVSSTTYIAPTGQNDFATKKYVDDNAGDASGGITYTPTTYTIKANTTDGSDNKRILIEGGGDFATGRGAYIGIYGNEFAGGEGTLEIYGGDATTGGSGNVNIGSRSTTGELRLSTNNSIRWLVDSGGHYVPNGNITSDIGNGSNYIRNLYIDSTIGTRVTLNRGSASAASASGFNVQVDGTTYGYFRLSDTDTTLDISANQDMYFFTGGSARWSIAAAGGLRAEANNAYDIGSSGARVATIYAVNALNTSDQRLKQGIISISSSDALDKVCGLDPIRYTFKPEYDDGSARVRTGFLAQEVIDEIPEAVVAGDSNNNLEFGDEGFEAWSMQTDHIIPYLVGAIKKLKEELEAAKARITVLEN